MNEIMKFTFKPFCFQVEFVLSVNGSINGSLICYILPGLIYIKANGKSNKLKIMANVIKKEF
jgi:hypothetical protein